MHNGERVYTNTNLMVPSGGGVVHVTDLEGEWLYDIPLAAGSVIGSSVMRSLQPGCIAVAGEDVVVLRRTGVAEIIRNARKYETAANPRWSPDPLTARDRQIDRQIKTLTQLEMQLRGRLKAAYRVETPQEEQRRDANAQSGTSSDTQETSDPENKSGDAAGGTDGQALEAAPLA